MALVQVNDANFQDLVLNSSKPFLLDFTATWCGPCQQLKPILEELSGEVEATAVIGYVDIDQSPTLASKHGVTSVPTMILFKGGEPAERILGARPKSQIAQAIAKAS